MTNEQYLAGCILLEPTVIWGADGCLTADDFQSEHCRAIFEAARDLKDEGAVIDPVSIREKAMSNGVELPHDYLAQLMEIVPTTANFAEYARRVAKDAKIRRIKEVAAQTLEDNTAEPDELLTKLQKGVNSLPREQGQTGFLSLFKPMTDFSEEEAAWLIPGWVPEGQITLIAADGGVGKTTLWCNIIAALSSGTRCILDPVDHVREPMKIAFFSSEDSVKRKLRKKLREAGANMENIITVDMSADKSGSLRDFKFGSEKMGQFVRHFKPAACVFDPVQGFLPPKVNMGSRNEMRDCIAPLVILGEDVGTTFLVVCHTNKRKGACGRDRIADSADLWDIARSVIMAGYTETQGVRYLSNEKNNYTQLQETILFSIGADGQLRREGTSWKRDREYMLEGMAAKSAPKLDDCRESILTELKGSPNQCIKSDDLIKKVQGLGFAFDTIKRARKQLIDDGVIENHYLGTAGKRGGRLCFVRFRQEETEDFEQLGIDTATPFDGENSDLQTD